MQRIGTVKSIWRYPVKGMAGEQLNTADLQPMGIRGDRQMAVQDVARNEIQSCKFRPALLQCRARYSVQDDVNSMIAILFPDGELMNATDSRINQRLSQLVGHDSKLQSLKPASDHDFYRRYKRDDDTWLNELKATFAREPGEPLPDLDNLPKAMQEYVALLGSFFLVSPFHLITTASLNYLHQQNPSADWHEERFRPNLVIETDPALSGLVEQSWLSHQLQIGDVIIDCSAAAPRCGAVSQAQQNLKPDSTMLRTIVSKADQNLGIYGDIVNSGHITLGDSVYLLEHK